jgi:Trehalose utilisation
LDRMRSVFCFLPTAFRVGLTLAIGLASVHQTYGQTPVATQVKKILVLNKSQGGTNGFLESRRDMKQALNELALTHGFQIDSIGQSDGKEKTSALFSASSLTQYQAVLFAYNEGVHAQMDSISKINVENYVNQGGTLMAIHAASAFVVNWPWYTESLVQSFYGPWGSNQPRIDVLHDSEGLAEGSETRGIFEGLVAPKRFLDMFISFKASPRGAPGVTILATIDEKSSDKTVSGAMGADHPVVWVKAVGKGKVIHNSLGMSWSTNNGYAQADGYLTKLTWGLLRYAAGDFKETSAGVRRPTRGARSTLLSGAQLDRFPVQFSVASQEPFQVELRDAQGRIVDSRSGVGPYQVQLQTPSQRGIYFLTLQAGSRSETQRVRWLK